MDLPERNLHARMHGPARYLGQRQLQRIPFHDEGWRKRPRHNRNPGYVGYALFECHDGTWTISDAHCDKSIPCHSEDVTWGNGNCSGHLFSGNTNDKRTVDNRNAGYRGSITYECKNGTWQPTSPGTCEVDHPCPAQSVTWGSDCTGNLRAAAEGTTQYVRNTNLDAKGAARFVCRNGKWEYVTGTCTAP